MSNGTGGGFPICKLGALLILVGMTALPFVSCGMLEIDGHHILRNKVPEFDELNEMGNSLGNAFTDAAKDAMGPDGTGPNGSPITINPTGAQASSDKPETLFEGGYLWLWFLYLGLFGMGIAGFFFRDEVKTTLWLGIAGLIGVFIWINQFEKSLLSRSDGPSEMPDGFSMFEADTGAYLTYVGFILFIVAAVWKRSPAPRGSPAPAPEPAGPPADEDLL